MAQTVAFVGSFFTGGGEIAAVEGGAAKLLARVTRARGGGCFLAGTPVQMADGTTRPIERVRAGDLVKSRDPKTGVTEARRVLQTTVRQTGAVLTLTVTDPKTGHRETITTTGEHPFYVDGRGFVKAEDLGIGTSIVTRAGPCLTLSSVAWQTGRKGGESLLGGKPSSFTVYNLIVEGDHTYFVGTAGGGAWVHNVDCPYPVHFQTVLDPTIWGTNDYQHFKAAGQDLLQAFNQDMALRDRLMTISGRTQAEVRTAIEEAARGGKSPDWFTWHHATRAQGGGRAGVMQLVTRTRHAKLKKFFHPQRIGGYEEWAIPAGATPRR